ncbi:MAG TPA: tetrahydrofolate dehydrogenase/cyclohydrolase catalytic domain-containing protein [Thermoanaerobaculia bacterium]|jgi:methylenetetrahydrofolate dehydrogenase (NADP+)/methenyltetrahydrofolate cyclohydrolase|nr:tetrahydrofolate dehydrogenase/cyclohydrolase catalytic domain-containing protein [Thermoanaerobaculia bacterium]
MTRLLDGRILDGKAAAAEIRAEVAAGVRELAEAGARLPQLVAVLVGEDTASQAYVGSKTRGCAEVGMLSQTLRLPAETSEAELLATVDRLNGDDAVDGILVQLPLPPQITEKRVLDRISPEKDVDGFHPISVGRLWLDEEGFTPATPTGIVSLLKRNGIPLSGRRAVIVGRSAIVGKPMAGLLLRENCTVTVCHSRTRDLAAVTREADILVAAIGRAGLIGPDHVREGAVVVDVGMNRLGDAAETERLYPGDEARRQQVAAKGYTLVGDVDFTRVAPKAAAITPVPGGVGPLTVAMVISNTLKAARRRQGLPVAP